VTHAFRSISGLASRRRVRPIVERATFVVATLGEKRVAFPVEWVERVVRALPAHDGTVRVGDRQLVVREMATALGLQPITEAGATTRILVLRNTSFAAESHAVVVNAVHEVYAVDIALIRPAHERGTHPAADHSAIRGVFERQSHTVWVLDPSRVQPHAP
jgi:chemotaxis signal transduction protein